MDNQPAQACTPATSKRRSVKTEPYHAQMLESLAAGESVEEAAKKCGISRRTGYNWAKRHAAEIQRGRAVMVENALSVFAASLPAAGRTLHELTTNPKASAADGAATRRAAASDLVACFERLTRIGDLDARLAAIEERLAASLAPAPTTTFLTRQIS